MYVSPSKTCSTGSTCDSAAMPCALRWMALSASHGRAECPLRPRNVHVALTFPRQPDWRALAVGSTTARSAVPRPGSRSSSGCRALRATGSSSRPKKTNPRSSASPAVPLAARSITAQLHHHGQRALHVHRAEAVDDAVLDAARDVVLRGNGVDVPGQQREGALAALGDAGQDERVARVAHRDAGVPQDGQDVGSQGCLPARLGGDVDELERPGRRGAQRGRRSRGETVSGRSENPSGRACGTSRPAVGRNRVLPGGRTIRELAGPQPPWTHHPDARPGRRAARACEAACVLHRGARGGRRPR